MALDIPIFYVKDKQAFRQEAGSYRLLGNPAQICRELAGKGAKLIHIIDLDAKKGSTANMDIYDKLTYFVNIEVECSAKKEIIKRLLGIKARVMLELVPKMDLSAWKKNERLLVGIAKPGYAGNAEGVHDVIIENAGDAEVERFLKLKKRVIVHGSEHRKLNTENRKLLWGVLKPI